MNPKLIEGSRLTLEQEEKLVREVYENFPEACLSFRCTLWKYRDFRFEFIDTEDGDKPYTVELTDAVRGLRLFAAAVLRGELKGLNLPAHFLTDTGSWDASAFDALNQMAIFGKVIYG